MHAAKRKIQGCDSNATTDNAGTDPDPSSLGAADANEDAGTDGAAPAAPSARAESGSKAGT